MKIKRYKKVNKHLNFYVNNYNFRKPYQILVDGTFCLTALNNKINIADNIPRYLQGEIKLLTTQCVVIEVENLGRKLGGALHILKQYGIHKCGHEGKPIPASKCLRSMLGKSNQNHYIIATQDRELQDQVRNIIGVPLLYLHLKTPVLEQPSEKTVEDSKNKLIGISSIEIEAIEDLKAKILEDKSEVKKPKRKKPKAPNPLSCKKKKRIAPSEDSVAKMKSEGIIKKKRKKIRIPQHVKEELLKK